MKQRLSEELVKHAISGEEAGEWLNKKVLDRKFRGGHTLRNSTQGASRRFWQGPSAAAGSVLGGTANWIGDGLLGEKAKTGPFAGRRLHPMKGGLEQGALQAISPKDARAIQSGKTLGEVVEGTVGAKKQFFKRKFRPQGLAGWALKNKGKAGLAALLAYAMTSKGGRDTATGIVQGMTPRGPTGPTKDVEREWGMDKSSPQQSVLQRDTWG